MQSFDLLNQQSLKSHEQFLEFIETQILQNQLRANHAKYTHYLSNAKAKIEAIISRSLSGKEDEKEIELRHQKAQLQEDLDVKWKQCRLALFLELYNKSSMNYIFIKQFGWELYQLWKNIQV